MDAPQDTGSTWRVCSACKRPIAYSEQYWVCSVSTCNKARSPYVFCRLTCWDSHVPVMNHRDAWAEERTAPGRPRDPTAARPGLTPPRPGVPNQPDPQRRMGRPEAADEQEDEILVVASRLKKYVKDNYDLNTAESVLKVLSDRVRRLCDDAARQARHEGRKTLMDRDFK